MSNNRLGPYAITKWQTKILTADVTSNGAMTDLTYTLEIGKTYRIFTRPLMQADGDNDASARVEVKDGSTEIDRIEITAASSGNLDLHTLSSTIIHTMANTSLTFVANSASANAFILGNNTKQETFVTVEELPNHEEVSSW